MEIQKQDSTTQSLLRKDSNLNSGSTQPIRRIFNRVARGAAFGLFCVGIGTAHGQVSTQQKPTPDIVEYSQPNYNGSTIRIDARLNIPMVMEYIKNHENTAYVLVLNGGIAGSERYHMAGILVDGKGINFLISEQRQLDVLTYNPSHPSKVKLFGRKEELVSYNGIVSAGFVSVQDPVIINNDYRRRHRHEIKSEAIRPSCTISDVQVGQTIEYGSKSVTIFTDIGDGITFTPGGFAAEFLRPAVRNPFSTNRAKSGNVSIQKEVLDIQLVQNSCKE
jgi:hypothetical protein